jgi:hypothetical protein
MSETNMSPYIKGFNAGVDCVLTEIERLEKIAPINLQQLLKHLDPQRDQNAAPKPDKGAP